MISKPKAYYNEFDPYAAQWLRNLIAAGHIADGVVDERSISDVTPNDLCDFRQCHFFAGIGVWSAALRAAGWPDSRPIWTGSAPCQPFSEAGEGEGFADERHLWPHWHWLISKCRPSDVLGEQVEAAIRHAWLDLVQADLEGEAYVLGAVGLCSAGVGSPNPRHRLFFGGYSLESVADPLRAGRSERRAESGGGQASGGGGTGYMADTYGDVLYRCGNIGAGGRFEYSDGGGGISELADAQQQRLEGYAEHVDSGNEPRRNGENSNGSVASSGATDGLAHSNFADACEGRQQRGRQLGGACSYEGHCGPTGGPANSNVKHRDDGGRDPHDVGGERRGEAELRGGAGPVLRTGPTNGFWGGADWLLCRPDRPGRQPTWRPVEPGTFPLAHGPSSRMGRGGADPESESQIPRKDRGHRIGRLRGYGNAINKEVATEFIVAYMQARGELA